MPAETDRSSGLPLVVAALAAALVACSLRGEPRTTPTGAASGGMAEPTTGAATATPPEDDACAHRYFPATHGARWEYQGSAGADGPYNYVETVSRPGPDGFTLTADFGDLTRTQEWSCTGEGLVALDPPAAGPVAGVASGGANLVLEATGVTGVTLPADLGPGQTWTQIYQVQGVQTLPDGRTMAVSGSASASLEAAGFEEVAVPAGAFTALRIDRTVTLNLTAAIGGGTMPLVLESRETVYFAEGVGMVRLVAVATVLGEPVEDVIVLVGSAIP
jgi:hypothetical protein